MSFGYYYNLNSNPHSRQNINFRAQNVVAPNTPLAKPIEKVTQTLESSVDVFVPEGEKKKKSKKRAIAVSSAVLVLGGLTLLANPKMGGKLSKKIKNLQSKLDLKAQQSKDSFLKSKFYSGCQKVFGVTEKGLHVYFNFNSGKDVVFKSFCTNTNKKYPEFLTKNKTVHKIVKAVDDFFVKILSKPHETITKWFDSISQYTVKNKYKNAAKSLDNLENFIRSNMSNLPKDKQKLLESKLKEIAEARKVFSNESLSKRFVEQEKAMQNLENDLWKNIYTKEQGLIKNPTSFWVQDALKTQKEQLQKNGNELVEKLVGSKNKQGLYDEVAEIVGKDLDEVGKQNLDNLIKTANKKLRKANQSECVEYFDKKRDLVVGGAPTDIVTQLFGLGLCGWAIGSANKEDRLQRALTTGLPVATGLGSSLVFSALLYSGGVGLLAGAAVSGVTSLICTLINKYVFGNKEPEIDTKDLQANNK